MAKMTRALAISGLVVAATWGSGAVHAQRTAGLNTTQTIQISAATKFLDLGSSTSSEPGGWDNESFDDSSWQAPAQVSSDVTSCVVQNHGNLSAMQNTPNYWGTNAGDDYLVRQTFALPAAKGYYGSTILYGADYNASLHINGQDTSDSANGAFSHPGIGQYLHAGANVIAFALQSETNPDGNHATTSQNVPCSAFTFTINLVVTDIHTNTPPQQKQAAMATTVPGSNAVLTGNSLPFSWNRYNGASYYYLQMWMDNAGPGQRITSRTTTMYSARLTGTGFTLNVNHFAKGTYSWRMAAVGGAGNLLTVCLSFAQIGSQFESAATTTCSIRSGYATTYRKCRWLS